MNETLSLELEPSNQEPTTFEKIASTTLLSDLEKEFNIGRAAVVIRKTDGWVLGGSLRIDFEDFWKDAPISLSVLHDVLVSGQDLVVVDADLDQKFQNRDSIFLGGMLNIACVGQRNGPGHSKVLVYVDNQVDNWAIKEGDTELLRAALVRYFPDWSLD